MSKEVNINVIKSVPMICDLVFVVEVEMFEGK